MISGQQQMQYVLSWMKLTLVVIPNLDNYVFIFILFFVFRYISDRTILIVGQDASRHGEVQIDSALFTHYDGEKQLRRSRANRLSLSSSIKCVVSINDYLIIVSTADGTLLLIDIRETFFNYVGYFWIFSSI